MFKTFFLSLSDFFEKKKKDGGGLFAFWKETLTCYATTTQSTSGWHDGRFPLRIPAVESFAYLDKV